MVIPALYNQSSLAPVKSFAVLSVPFCTFYFPSALARHASSVPSPLPQLSQDPGLSRLSQDHGLTLAAILRLLSWENEATCSLLSKQRAPSRSLMFSLFRSCPCPPHPSFFLPALATKWFVQTTGFHLQQATQTRSSAGLRSHSWTTPMAAQASQLVGFARVSLGHPPASKPPSGRESLS